MSYHKLKHKTILEKYNDETRSKVDSELNIVKQYMVTTARDHLKRALLEIIHNFGSIPDNVRYEPGKKDEVRYNIDRGRIRNLAHAIVEFTNVLNYASDTDVSYDFVCLSLGFDPTEIFMGVWSLRDARPEFFKLMLSDEGNE